MSLTTTLPTPEPSDTEMVPAPGPATSYRFLTGVFVVAAFLGSTLLFLVQPLVARLILPLAGGSAALWNTAMVFFQVALLLGYGFAHLSVRRLSARRHPILQAGLIILPLAVLPLAVPDGWSLPSDAAPAAWVLLILTVMVGLPFFALATTSPTLQMWLSSTSHPRAADPYFLYAAGNIGSVLALVGYPLVLEPTFSLTAQTRIWALGYVAFVVACIAAGVLTRRYSAESTEIVEELSADSSIPTRQKLRWLLWAFVPSALMLGVTLHISTDLAAFPLLWIIPLLLYLVTFIIAFGKDSATRTTRTATLVWYGGLVLAATVLLQPYIGIYGLIVHLAWFFFAALLCHAKLASDRPATRHLTTFYFLLSLGGALGGIFASLVAPLIFPFVLEYPITIGLALAVAAKLGPMRLSGTAAKLSYVAMTIVVVGVIAAPAQLLWFLIAAGILLLVAYGPVGAILAIVVLLTVPTTFYANSDVVLQDRSFFGVYKVADVSNGVRNLVSGTTVHGTQMLEFDGPLPPPTTYYFDEGPVGQIFDIVQPSDVGVIGLGAGTMASYADVGDNFTFWEIDQLVVDIAENPDYFTYLSATPANVEILVEDGRHGLATTDKSFDLLVVDAFGSDAIPVHLLTAEAMQVYVDHVKPGGSLLIHVSNRHFDLRPVVAAAASEASGEAWVQQYRPTDEAFQAGAVQSTWIAVSPDSQPREWMETGLFSPINDESALWTDDYSNVLGTLRILDN